MENFNLLDNLDVLKRLFPKKEFDKTEEERLERNYELNHGLWKKNLETIGNTKIKYLLICEAPPESGDYFYSSKETSLLKNVYRTFFDRVPRTLKASDMISGLVEKGFLLIDTLPYAMNYGNHRFNPEYYNLIQACMPWWLNNLKNVSFADDLKIAFGFNQNALNVMIALSHYNQSHKLQRFYSKYPFTPQLIAESSAGQPTTKRLKNIFL
jgi:hypothetical protein